MEVNRITTVVLTDWHDNCGTTIAVLTDWHVHTRRRQKVVDLVSLLFPRLSFGRKASCGNAHLLFLLLVLLFLHGGRRRGGRFAGCPRCREERIDGAFFLAFGSETAEVEWILDRFHAREFAAQPVHDLVRVDLHRGNGVSSGNVGNDNSVVLNLTNMVHDY